MVSRAEMVGASVKVLSGLLILVLAVLALNGLAYGGLFIFSPGQGLLEFIPAGDAHAPVLHLLVSLLGLALWGAMGFALFSIALIVRRSAAGYGVSLLLGLLYLGMAVTTGVYDAWVDTMIYGAFGTALVLLSLGILYGRASKRMA